MSGGAAAAAEHLDPEADPRGGTGGARAMQPSASTSSNLVQQLLTELDQVFATALAEDVGTCTLSSCYPHTECTHTWRLPVDLAWQL